MDKSQTQTTTSRMLNVQVRCHERAAEMLGQSARRTFVLVLGFLTESQPNSSAAMS
jgi:hypothetical protein